MSALVIISPSVSPHLALSYVQIALHTDSFHQAQWPNPPNFLLVDYYNEGSFPGSVFEVAAIHNNVTYNGKCCGLVPSAAFEGVRPNFKAMVTVVVGLGVEVMRWI